jgi:hypothetical protein
MQPLAPSLALPALLLLSSAVPAQQYVDQRVLVPGTGPGTAAPGFLESGDLDGDGREDLIVRLDYSTDWVFRGGAGAEPFTYVHLVDGSDAHDAEVADLDGDGDADYLTQDFVNNGWYPGGPGAVLGAFQKIQAEGPNETFWNRAAGDLDGDGLVDVVLSLATDSSGFPGQVRWHLGTGGGSFGAPQSITTPERPIDMALGDYDADGMLDVAYATVVSGPAHVLVSQPGGFAPPEPVGHGAAAWRVERGDFDADGIDDLACCIGGSALEWFRGGAGGFQPGGSVPYPEPTVSPRDLFAADVDQDGASDLLVAWGIATNGAIYHMRGQAGVGLGPVDALPASSTGAVRALDIDGEPGLDLVYLPTSWRYPALRPGDGAGGFLAPDVKTAADTCADSDAFSAGDLDGDGALDLAFEAGTWMRGDGAGGFLPEAPLGARASELVDLDGDGVLDAIARLPECAPPGGLVVSLALGGGSFAPAVHPPQAAGILDVAVADLDADGDLDLASAGDLGVWTHLNDGAGAFGPYVTTALPGFARNVGAGDLDLDGLADLACTTYFETWSDVQSRLAWALSIGGGHVGAVQDQLLYQSPTEELRIDDVNGDGDLDVAWAQTSFGQVVAAYGDGTGALAPAAPVATFWTGLAFTLADVDGDGARDILAGSAGSDARVGVARRVGDGYEPWIEIGVASGAGKIVPADLDADGQLDLLIGYGRSVRVANNLLGDALGTTPFGAGTPGCLGRAGLGAREPAAVGNLDFRVLAHNLPPHGLGWFGLGTTLSLPGVDPVGLGALMHVDPLASSFLEVFVAPADAAGQADVPLPIPASPTLAGVQVAVQALHLGTLGADCSISPLGLVSSRGLEIVVQP